MHSDTAEKIERFLKLGLAQETLAAAQAAALSSADSPTPRREESPAPRFDSAAFQMHRIMVPVDFSPPSEKAVAYAVRVAEMIGAQLILVHVVPPVSLPLTFSASDAAQDRLSRLNKHYQEAGAQVLVRWGERLSQAARAPIPVPRTELRFGPVREEILKAVRELPADLIIMASRGLTGLKHLFLGGTTDYIVHHAPCPVLVVREDDSEDA